MAYDVVGASYVQSDSSRAEILLSPLEFFGDTCIGTENPANIVEFAVETESVEGMYEEMFMSISQLLNRKAYGLRTVDYGVKGCFDNPSQQLGEIKIAGSGQLIKDFVQRLDGNGFRIDALENVMKADFAFMRIRPEDVEAASFGFIDGNATNDGVHSIAKAGVGHE